MSRKRFLVAVGSLLAPDSTPPVFTLLPGQRREDNARGFSCPVFICLGFVLGGGLVWLLEDYENLLHTE